VRASLIAWSAVAAGIELWLEGFANHMDLPQGLVPAAAEPARLVAFLTVVVHMARAARSPRVAAQRHEMTLLRDLRPGGAAVHPGA
jgi:hypothetical protein